MSPAAMSTRQVSPPQALEALVAVVATLGELAATVTAPRRRAWPLLYPESLHKNLREFTWTLRDNLDHHSANLLGQRGVTSLPQAVAALEATSGATRADAAATVRAWRSSLRQLEANWYVLQWKANELRNTWEIAATGAATATTTQAGELRDEAPPGRGTAGDGLVAAAPAAVCVPALGGGRT
ncbi:uncharacterized protein [Chamaea fasciata]|uniref:uncharacterized protein isoform X4 n=1 Tax=Chamaea fasciata TaxID=190680 RepID=UPI00336ADADB